MLDALRNNPRFENLFSVLFAVGMWWRVGYGSAKVLASIFLFQLIGAPVSEIFTVFQNYGLTRELATTLLRTIGPILDDHAFVVTYFLVSYVLFWGLIDVVLSLCMLRHILWAFPLSLTLIAIFVSYEIVRIFHTHSFILAYIIVVDIVLFWLIHHEYQKLRTLLHSGIGAPAMATQNPS